MVRGLGFVGDSEANALLTRNYRAPYVVPETSRNQQNAEMAPAWAEGLRLFAGAELLRGSGLAMAAFSARSHALITGARSRALRYRKWRRREHRYRSGSERKL